MEDLLAERQQLKQVIFDNEQISARELSKKTAQIQETMQLYQHASMESETLKAASNNWENLLREKVELIQNEKEQAVTAVGVLKSKWKGKIARLSEESQRKIESIERESSAKIKRLQTEVRELQQANDFLVYSEKHLKERILEIQQNTRREIEDAETRASAAIRNAEEDKRHHRSDADLKGFQILQIQQDLEREMRVKQKLEYENEEIKNENKELAAEVQLLI